MITDEGQQAESAEGLGPKERIFLAAMSIAVRKGFGKVTLNLVAREAGFSKGGLLYHFATKNDLIRAMLEHYADPAAGESEPVQAGAANSSISELDPLAVALLIAAADNPALLEPFRAQLRSDKPELTGRSKSMPGHAPLIRNLVAKFNLIEPIRDRRAGAEAFVVRHRTDESLLGLFVAQGIDALWDMVDEFSDPAEYEYRLVTNGALILSKHEADLDAFSAPNRPGHFECGGEMSGGLMDIVMAEGEWTSLPGADEGSGVIARTLEQLTELEQAPPGDVKVHRAKEADE